MSNNWTELRSDTFTKPTPAMLEAMMKAEVGDDVFGEDPTVKLLEEKSADLFGFEAGLYCPSGTMTNQIAIRCHTRPADEVICENLAHVYIYEGGGMASNSLAQARPLQGRYGIISAEQAEAAINPDDVHKARTSLVCLENTSNRGGGSCYTQQQMTDMRDMCNRHGLSLHLDGARVFNAIVAGNEDPRSYGQIFDSVSVCLSKGLGAPVGSVLLGNRDFIRQARRIRKMFGGGMRQAGFLAAAGIYALDHHVQRLSEDHEHAQLLAEALKNAGFAEEIYPVQTNIVIFTLKDTYSSAEFASYMQNHGIKVAVISDRQIRLVTHLDVSRQQILQACDRIAGFKK